MTLDTLIMLSGAFVAILPFLGFPNSVDKVLFLIAGVFVIGLGIIVRRRGLREPRASREITNETAENSDRMRMPPSGA
ncbi:MAG: hypothetical protein UY63_C0006G0020 [Parcubacteria group bacterium GW2011_GWA2_51_10]|nr:MAG: hypothetical protein UY63_C0006G0020 [Parcubacteria group bacterium GW2011_GWA2_51_10]